MNILFAILIQAPFAPEPKPVPVSNIIIERFMLKGEEPDMSNIENTNKYF